MSTSKPLQRVKPKSDSGPRTHLCNKDEQDPAGERNIATHPQTSPYQAGAPVSHGQPRVESSAVRGPSAPLSAWAGATRPHGAALCAPEGSEQGGRWQGGGTGGPGGDPKSQHSPSRQSVRPCCPQTTSPRASWGLPCLGGTVVAGDTAWEGQACSPWTAPRQRVQKDGSERLLECARCPDQREE